MKRFLIVLLVMAACKGGSNSGKNSSGKMPDNPQLENNIKISLDSNDIKRLSEQLVYQELKAYEGPEYRPVKRGDESVYDTSGMWRAHLYAELVSGGIADLNGDGLDDAVFHVLDEGLGGGGNAFGYDYHVLLLNAKKEIQSEHTFFGGGKLSMAMLGIDTIRDGKIYATYEENGYANVDADSAELRRVDVVFYMKDNRLVEAQYEKCPMAQMDKRIFRDDVSGKIQRETTLDDSYNEESRESYVVGDGTTYLAMLSGCSDMELSFRRTIPFQPSLENNRAAAKAKLLSELDLLRRVTRFAPLLEETKAVLTTVLPEQMEQEKYGGISTHLVLKKDWQAHLFVSGNEEQGTYLTISFVQSPGGKEKDFWEKLEAKQKR